MPLSVPILPRLIPPEQTPATPRLHPRVLVGLGTAGGLLMVLGGVVWAALAGQDLPEAWFPRDRWQSDILIGVTVGVVFTWIAWHAFRSVPSLRRIKRLFLAMLDMPAMRGHHALIFGLLAGIPEEILFRGAMQPAWGLLLTSVIFGALHAVTFAYFLYAALAGLLLGGLVLWRGALWAPMAAHIVIDTLMFLLLIRHWRRQRRAAQEFTSSLQEQGW